MVFGFSMILIWKCWFVLLVGLLALLAMDLFSVESGIQGLIMWLQFLMFDVAKRF